MQATVVFLVAVLAALAAGQLTNKEVERTIDMKNHLVTMTVKQTVVNNGKSSVTSVQLAHDEGLKDKLAFISATNVDTKDKLTVDADHVQVTIDAGKTVQLSLVMIYTHAQLPFPKAITQEETQLVQFHGNAYYSSPYPTTKQSTEVKVPGRVESATTVKPSSKADGKVSYGPYSDVAASATQPITVHFENNTPFLTVTKHMREVEVSHWGNVAVSEFIDLKHTGAELKGSFSRLDYQRVPNSGRSSVRSFTMKLPASAADVFYRDLIGNISTSNMREEDTAVVLELRPRFPLFGGWKTFYTVTYNLPSYEVLSRDGSNFKLSVRFVDHLYDNMVIDHTKLRVILPEGASDIKASAPFSVQEKDQETIATYLDTVGRPILVFEKDNLVEEHMENIVVSYTFNQSSLVREPAMVITFLLLIFAFVIFYNRIDFSIDTESDEAKRRQALERASGKWQELKDVFEARIQLVESLRSNISNKADSKDVLAKLKDAHKQATDICSDLANIDAGVAAKAKDIVDQAIKQVDIIASKTKGAAEDLDDKLLQMLSSLE
eukprot:m.23142 g.23142  ORF g.23142 m.23142 type:complete len:550 (+) comp10997_c0_seq1:72-1721(+)